MLCGNFVAEDVNATIKLPEAIQARPLDKAEEYVIFLNVDKDGVVLLGRDRNAEKLTNPVQVKNYMAVKMTNDRSRQEAAKKRGAPEPKPSLVVVRAHQDCTYKQVNDVLVACRQAGYRDVQLRATVASAKS
jgi:biopolymer transport protein ExbD